MKLRYGYNFFAFPLQDAARNTVRKTYRQHRRRWAESRASSRKAATELAMWFLVAPQVTELGVTSDAPEWMR